MRQENYTTKLARFFIAFFMSLPLLLGLVFLALTLSGAAPGRMIGTPSTPLCGAFQTFYGYACPEPSTTVIWLSEPTWEAGFIANYCRYLDSGGAQ